MTERPSIGLVLGSEDATPLQFWFAVAESVKVQLDDIVVVTVADPAGAGPPVSFFGLVDQVRRRLEGIQFDGDTELVAAGLMPASVAYAAHVLVTRVDPEEFIPPGPGDPVYAAEGPALAKALYLDGMEAPVPAGVLRGGEPAYLNLDFIDGTKGAHVNISGISGIATKTSYALFLLHSVFNARTAGGQPVLENPGTAKALVFNVKGEDLLYLDRPNSRFREQEARWMEKHRTERSRYERCGLPEVPFRSCALHAPARPSGRGEALLADVGGREGVTPFVWSLHAFALERMLPFALADGDSMSNLGFLVANLEERLHRLAAGQSGPDLAVEEGDVGFTLDEDRPGIGAAIGTEEALSLTGFDRATGPLRLKTFDDLVRYLEYKLLGGGSEEDDRSGGDPRWTARQAKATREALVRRLRGAARHLGRLVRGDLSARTLARARLDILDSDRQVHVVDLYKLAPLAQMFTVGVILRRIFGQKEEGRRDRVFVVLDELNKYAPAEGESPIKEVLLDIAERGRSLGVILIGAQQTASEVERRVVANAAVRVVGRVDAAEADRNEYRFMPSSFRLRSTILAPGTMIVHQPDVPTPMMVTFPYPAWATRRSEVADEVSDQEAQDLLEG